VWYVTPTQEEIFKVSFYIQFVDNVTRFFLLTLLPALQP